MIIRTVALLIILIPLIPFNSLAMEPKDTIVVGFAVGDSNLYVDPEHSFSGTYHNDDVVRLEVMAGYRFRRISVADLACFYL